MKKLYKKLPALASDYSGAFSVLFEMNCLKVLHGQGGCTGNYCYADELRWMDRKKNVFHSGMSEIEAITGNDQIVIDKVVQAQKDLECDFVAICGSPIPTVLGTDIRAIARLIQKRTDCPVLAIDTHGLGRYDQGQKMAYEELVKCFARPLGNGDNIVKSETRVNVIGATPLDGWTKEMTENLTNKLYKQGYDEVAVWGMGADIQDIARSSTAKLNIAVSVSGLSTVKNLEQEYGTPYRAGYFIGTEERIAEDENIGKGKRACVLTEQFTGNAIRACLKEQFGFDSVDIISFFMMEKEFMEPDDAHVQYEDDLESLLKRHPPYDVVIGDAFISRFFAENQPYIVIPHPAVCAHNNAPYITEYSYEPHLAMVVGDYNTPKFVNLVGENGYRFLRDGLKRIWRV